MRRTKEIVSRDRFEPVKNFARRKTHRQEKGQAKRKAKEIKK